jgi:dihydropteroate synthase
MAIVNVTPDSFSGDGRATQAEAVAHALAQLRAGADMLDIGGESTRPGHQPVSVEEEIARVTPVIAGVRKAVPDAVISVDTYKPAVICAAHDAGADIVNSVWGATDEVLAAVSERNMPLAIMHNQDGTVYPSGVIEGVCASLLAGARRATAAGIPHGALLVDPGIGFGKTADQNIEVLAQLDAVAALGYPVILGTSRKSTIGKLTARDAHERIYGTAATTALGIRAGVAMVRVHDVAQQRDAISVSDAIVRNWRPPEWIG